MAPSDVHHERRITYIDSYGNSYEFIAHGDSDMDPKDAFDQLKNAVLAHGLVAPSFFEPAGSAFAHRELVAICHGVNILDRNEWSTAQAWAKAIGGQFVWSDKRIVGPRIKHGSTTYVGVAS